MKKRVDLARYRKGIEAVYIQEIYLLITINNQIAKSLSNKSLQAKILALTIS